MLKSHRVQNQNVQAQVPQQTYIAKNQPAGGYATYVAQPAPVAQPQPAMVAASNVHEQRQIQEAVNNGVYEKVDFEPRDDDMLKLYWCRETDGEWTLRNRLTMDQKEVFGDYIWYLTGQGLWYAVRKRSN